MIVLVIDGAMPAVRGELTRWLLEVRAGVFVGTVPASVRDKLWDLVFTKVSCGAALMIHSARNEQGFEIRSFGFPGRLPADFDGLTLMRRPS